MCCQLRVALKLGPKTSIHPSIHPLTGCRLDDRPTKLIEWMQQLQDIFCKLVILLLPMSEGGGQIQKTHYLILSPSGFDSSTWTYESQVDVTSFAFKKREVSRISGLMSMILLYKSINLQYLPRFWIPNCQLYNLFSSRNKSFSHDELG